MVLLIVIVLVCYSNLNTQNNSNTNTTNGYLGKVILSDTIVNIQIPYSDKYKIIGILSPDDCSSCYSLLINEFNNLINNDIKDSVVFYVLDQHKEGNSFKENLIFRYRPRFPIVLLNKSIIPNKNLMWFLKTPLFIQIDNNGKLMSILQISINNQNILFKVIDNILKQKK